MSGIIGGAGSKSGIIGTTELDYEEGTWTPTGTNIAGYEGRYVKVGKIVTCEARVYASNVSSGMGGLPFTSVSGLNDSYGGGIVIRQNQTASQTWTVRVGASATTFSFYYGDTAVVIGFDKTAWITVTYRTA